MSSRKTKNSTTDNDTLLMSSTDVTGKVNSNGESTTAVLMTNMRDSDVNEFVLKTISTNIHEHENETEERNNDTDAKPKVSTQNHWTKADEEQLDNQIAKFRLQGNAGPILWELVSRKSTFNFTPEQCMSKWYREKTKERYKEQGKKRKEPSTTVKWDEVGTERLNGCVEQIKGQDFEGSKLWNLVAEALDGKWTPAQCMNKYYRDRHKLLKSKKTKKV